MKFLPDNFNVKGTDVVLDWLWSKVKLQKGEQIKFKLCLKEN